MLLCIVQPPDFAEVVWVVLFGGQAGIRNNEISVA